MNKTIIFSIIALLIGIFFDYAGTQPQFTIYRALYGLKFDMPSQFEAAVNVEAVSTNAVNDLVKAPITNALGDNDVSKFLANTLGNALRKPIEEKVNTAIANVEATGRVDKAQSEAGKTDRMPGFGSYSFARIERVEQNSILADAVLIFHSDQDNHDIKVVVGLTRTGSDWTWTITSIRNLPDIVSELISEEAKGVRRDLSKAISPDDENADNHADTPDSANSPANSDDSLNSDNSVNQQN